MKLLGFGKHREKHDHARNQRDAKEANPLARKQRDAKEANPLLVIREGATKVEENPNDDDLAEVVQIQEVLFFQLQSDEVLQSPQDMENKMLEVASGELMTCNTSIEDPVDLKGKQPIEVESSYSTIELGECSKVVRDTFDCPICMESMPTEEGFNIETCDHTFCISCFIHYITVKIEENTTIIPCPTPGCETTSVDPERCQHILPNDTFNRWGLALCELLVDRKKFYCPFKDCSALLIDEGAKNITNSECPHCNRMFCARCKIPWHADMSCEEFQRRSKDEKEELMLQNLAKDRRWQRCPKCKMFVEKIDGCNFMKCRCHYCFCYACASPLSNGTHYCTKCKR